MSKAIVARKELADRFLDAQKPNTRRTYEAALGYFVWSAVNGIQKDDLFDRLTVSRNGERVLADRAIHDYPWGGLSESMIETILNDSRTAEGKQISNSTYNKRLACIRGLVRLALKDMHPATMHTHEYQDYFRLEAIMRMKGKRVGMKKRGRYITQDEIEKIREACAADTSPAGARDWALIVLAYERGPRVDELTHITVEDLDLGKSELKIHVAKGDKSRVIGFPEIVRDALKSWLEIRGGDDGALFCPVNKSGKIRIAEMSTTALQAILKKRCSQAGVKVTKRSRLAFHDLRKTSGSNVRERLGLECAQAMLGHASADTTRRSYILLSDQRHIDSMKLA